MDSICQSMSECSAQGPAVIIANVSCNHNSGGSEIMRIYFFTESPLPFSISTLRACTWVGPLCQPRRLDCLRRGQADVLEAACAVCPDCGYTLGPGPLCA